MAALLLPDVNDPWRVARGLQRGRLRDHGQVESFLDRELSSDLRGVGDLGHREGCSRARSTNSRRRLVGVDGHDRDDTTIATLGDNPSSLPLGMGQIIRACHSSLTIVRISVILVGRTTN